MGVRTRGLDITINAKRQVAEAAARTEAKGVVERWNEQLAASCDTLWSPTIRAPETGLLLGYLEYFGVHRVVVCLSRSYSGSTMKGSYGLNPLTGQTVSVSVTLPFSLDDIQAIYDYRKIPEGAVARAFSEVVPSALERQFEREKTRVIAEATRYAFANCGAKEGDLRTEEQKAKLPGL
jgi:hypothetical protein